MGGKGGGKGKKGSDIGYAPDDAPVEKQENGYTWSQKGEEVQVTFKLPKAAKKGDVKVQFKPASLEVSAFGEKLLGGKLAKSKSMIAHGHCKTRTSCRLHF